MKHIVTLLSLFISLSVAAQGLFSLPNFDPLNSEYFVMGRKTSSLMEEKIIFNIKVPADQPFLKIDIHNGNMESGIYFPPPPLGNGAFLAGVPGAKGGIQFDRTHGIVPTVQDQLEYTLRADGKVLRVASGDWFGHLIDETLFFVDNTAPVVDGFRHYELELQIVSRNEFVSDIVHTMKLQMNAPFTTDSLIGFMGKDYMTPPFTGVASNTTWDNTLKFSAMPKVRSDGLVCFFDAWNGDADYAGDTNSKITPYRLDQLPFEVTPDTLPEYSRPGNPPDSGVTARIENANGDVLFEDPDPSGDREWEKNRVISSEPGCTNNPKWANAVVPKLNNEPHSLVIDNLISDNVLFVYMKGLSAKECDPEDASCNPEPPFCEPED